ncbi:hypothetical protein [Paraburkholderia sediminicola]|uniref:hypothetical protein n=1 Tax=Paraburkholderia sediminicola TaxID=458836 RepID=UPI0038BBB431
MEHLAADMITDHSDEATLDGLIETFRRDFTRMGFWEKVIDLFTPGSHHATILNATALCFIASFPKGRAYLERMGELSQAEAGSLCLLKMPLSLMHAPISSASAALT